MRLELDCMRDILLDIEKTQFGEYVSFMQLCKNLPQYSPDILSYTCYKLYEAGFLDIKCNHPDNSPPIVISIYDITYEGHQFLANVRSNTVWNDIKEISKKVGSNSISAVSQIAIAVVTEIIKAQLKLA